MKPFFDDSVCVEVVGTLIRERKLRTAVQEKWRLSRIL